MLIIFTFTLYDYLVHIPIADHMQ